MNPRRTRLARRALLLAVSLLLVAFGGVAQAKDIQVTTDGGGFGTCNGDFTSCTTLREAVEHAKDGDVVHVPAFHIHLNSSNDGEIYADFTTTGLTIVGAGANQTIVDGDGQSRVFENGSDGILTLKNLTVTGGNGAEVPAGSVHAVDVPDGRGGGIGNDGSLTIDHVAVRDSTAGEGGGIGGGEVTGTDSEISGNTVQETHVSNCPSGINDGSGDGGGIFAELVTLTNTTVSNNSATLTTNISCDSNVGGGIAFGLIQLLNTTIAGNSVHTTQAVASQPGGAVCALGATNRSDGGGIAQDGNFFANKQPIESGNVQNTALANNTADTGPSNCLVFVKVVSGDYNISDDDSCTSLFTSAHDLNHTGLRLGPLQDNGGQTLTQAIDQTSPAFDHADSNGCPNHDQRDLPRPAFAACDTGAFELQPAPPSPPPAPVQQVLAQHVTAAGPTLRLAGAHAGCASATTRIRVRLTAAGGVRSVKVTLGSKVIKRTKGTSFTLNIKRSRLRVGHNVLKVVVTDAQGRHVTRRAPLTRCRVRIAPHFTG